MITVRSITDTMIYAFERAGYKFSDRIWKYYAQLDKLMEDWP